MITTKQSVGIDIAKKTFTACIAKLSQDRTVTFSEVVMFDNNKTGYNKLLRWVNKRIEKPLAVNYYMEATGTYYEPLAYHLHKLNKHVGVILANKVSYFSKSLNVKTKTDVEDARVISRMGVERELELWTPPSELYKELRSLTRLYNCFQKDKTMTTNRLSALVSSHEPHKLSIKYYKSIIKNLDNKLLKIENEMGRILKSDTELWSKVKNLMTIPGIGLKSIAIVLGETQGFKLFKNQRQLVSYCGLDVTRKESGTSVYGKSKISKKGNSHIRAALYLPAMSAARYNKPLKRVYDRINADKPSKKVGIVAVERRLLVLIFSLWKSGLTFNENYEANRISDFQVDDDSSSSSICNIEKVDGVIRLPSTQNEHLHEQASDVLLRK